VHSDDLPSGFVAKDVVIPDDHCGTYTSCMPEMYVGSADSRGFNGDGDFAGTQGGASGGFFE
jgi:hypothetical protein